jgi:hypothetical protein
MNSATTGDHSAAASTTGHYSAASTTGHYSTASTIGHHSAASTTGHRSAAATTGDHSAASTTGHYSAASTTGHYSTASTTGDHSAAFSAMSFSESAQNVAIGKFVRLSDSGMPALVLPVSDEWEPMLVSVHDADTEDGTPWQIGVWITMDDDGVVREHPEILLADDGRNYTLRFQDDSYTAGCRTFTATQAMNHWSNPSHNAPDSAARLLAAVLHHIETGMPS